jgi:plasmid maintenance system killer protein
MQQFRGLDPPQKRKVKSAVVKLSKNPNTKSLRLEPLKGATDFWSIRVTDGWRILLRIERDEAGAHYVVVEFGTHDVYRKV